MHNGKYIKVTDPNPEILTRVTEADVVAWLAEKLRVVREATKLPVTSIEIEANARHFYGEKYIDVSWSMHGVGGLALNHTTIGLGLKDLAEDILGNPKEKAADARDKARRLMAEAENFDRISQMGAKEETI